MRIARIANRQHGVVTRAQLLGAGLSAREVDRRIEAGVLLPVHRGVYRVGHRAPSVEADYVAAVLACGEGAVLCGRAAAHLLGLTKGKPPAPEVMTPGHRRRPGIATRQWRFDSHETMKRRGIRVTTPARTLVDLAAVLDPDDLARACHEAGVRYRTTPRQVKAVLVRHRNARGAGQLRRVMEGEVKVSLSVVEKRFLDHLRAERLPLPEANRAASGRRVDCRWPDHRLTVELVSYTYHSSRYAWEQDHRREREARGRRDDFRSYTTEDVLVAPGQMLAELRAVLLGGRNRPT